MLSKTYAAQQAEHIDLKRAAFDVAAGWPEAHEDTTCFCTADRAGNLVCILQSIQSGFGSNLIAGETGILLNNRMTYWHLEEGHPNCLMPGKRVAPYDESRHCDQGWHACSDVRDAGRADTQMQTNLQLVTHLLDFGMTPQEAVAAPRWRSLQNPMESTIPHVCSNNLQLEDRFPADVQGRSGAQGARTRTRRRLGRPGQRAGDHGGC